jgi:hypothetical protein
MPTEEMFWGNATYINDGARVPLRGYRCKAHLHRVAGATQVPTAHKCKLAVDHEGDHKCICDKTWAQNRRARS